MADVKTFVVVKSGDMMIFGLQDYNRPRTFAVLLFHYCSEFEDFRIRERDFVNSCIPK